MGVQINIGSLEKNNGNSIVISSENFILHPKFDASDLKSTFDVALLRAPKINPSGKNI